MISFITWCPCVHMEYMRVSLCAFHTLSHALWPFFFCFFQKRFLFFFSYWAQSIDLVKLTNLLMFVGVKICSYDVFFFVFVFIPQPYIIMMKSNKKEKSSLLFLFSNSKSNRKFFIFTIQSRMRSVRVDRKTKIKYL